MIGIDFDYNPNTGKYEEGEIDSKSDLCSVLDCDDCGRPMDSDGVSFWDGSNETLRCSRCRNYLALERQKAKHDLDEIDRILNEE